jgi:putative transposase
VSRKATYQVKLNEDERKDLHRYLRRGKSSARSLTRARILLLADEGHPDKGIVEALKVSRSTVALIRKRYCQEGLESVLYEKSRSGAPPKIDTELVHYNTSFLSSIVSMTNNHVEENNICRKIDR